MKVICNKIRETKIGRKNPQATEVKCKNEKTGEIFYFGSLSEMQLFFKESNHSALGGRCSGKIKSLYKNIWQIAYGDEPFREKVEYGRSTYNSRKIKITNLITLENKIFKSFSAAEREYNLPKGKISKTIKKSGLNFIINNLEITILD